MNDSNDGIERLAGLALLDHPVEGVEGLAHVGQLLGIGVGQGLGHLVEVGLATSSRSRSISSSKCWRASEETNS